MNTMKSLFLSQSYNDNWDDYERSLSKVHFAKWDYIILTASNESQAEAYRTQIDYRIERGYLPSETHYAVLADPDGKRVGSGGATFNVMKYIAEREKCKDCFTGKRILVIHSGGDSKRVPQYSACGKLFSPVPRELPDGRSSTLFDEFIIGMSGVPLRIQDGMLVLSGDVLLLFNPLQIDFSSDGAACISFKKDVETGKNHGVFLGNENGFVKEFLHKQSVEQLISKGAVNSNGNVNIDTGAVIFSSKLINDLFGLISKDGKTDEKLFDKYVNDKVRLSFYADFIYPLSEDATLESYQKQVPEGDFSDELTECRAELWNVISKYNMKLLALSPAEFIHFGTTGELLSLMTDHIGDYKFLGWKSLVNSSLHIKPSFSCSNAYVQHNVSIGENSYIEDSYLMNGSQIGKNCIIASSTVNGVNIPDNTVIHTLKQKDGTFVTRIYGVNDNPKDMLENDGRYFGVKISEFIRINGLSEADLWDDSEHFLWNAKLYKKCATIEETLNFALNVCSMTKGCGNSEEFLKAERISLCDSFNQADVTAVLPWKLKLDDKIIALSFVRSIENGISVKQAEELFKNKQFSDRCLRYIENELEKNSFDVRMRGYYYLSRSCASQKSEEFETKCFKLIGDTVFESCKANIIGKDSIKICKNETEVRLPVRVNFGGGWSDTPPYCNEHGGAVLNAAIKLNGELPIVVKIKKLDRKVIAFESADSGAYGEFSSADDIRNCGNPFDPYALHKAALLAFGLVSLDGSETLESVLNRIGGGLYLSTEVLDIPRGSGLGTSSILSGACIKALYDFFGLACTDELLYSTVFVMEQIMSTGGGWQDQVGGLTGGFKLITSDPGLKQDIKLDYVKLSEETKEELQERFALIYTGQRRLARNLLREVVGNYIGGRKESVETLDKIQRQAALMKFELEKGNIDRFAKLMNEHWELSKLLDIGCTNTCIDQIFISVEDMLEGKMICGAGGGGFLQVILKKGCTKKQLNERLMEIFQDSGVGVWECEFVW